MSLSERVIKLPRVDREARLIPVGLPAGSPPAGEPPAEEVFELRARVLAEAQVEAERVRAEAYQVGFQQGLAEGKRAAELEAAEYLGRLRQLVETARLEHRRILREAEEQLLVLALAAAGHILARRLEADEQALVADFLAEAFREVEGATVVRIRVNPQDFDFVRAVVAERWGDLPVMADPRVEAGGCVVETASTLIDSAPTERLRQLARLFRQAHELEYRP